MSVADAKPTCRPLKKENFDANYQNPVHSPSLAHSKQLGDMPVIKAIILFTLISSGINAGFNKSTAKHVELSKRRMNCQRVEFDFEPSGKNSTMQSQFGYECEHLCLDYGLTHLSGINKTLGKLDVCQGDNGVCLSVGYKLQPDGECLCTLKVNILRLHKTDQGTTSCAPKDVLNRLKTNLEWTPLEDQPGEVPAYSNPRLLDTNVHCGHQKGCTCDDDWTPRGDKCPTNEL